MSSDCNNEDHDVAIFGLMYAYSQNLKVSSILFVSGMILVALLLLATYGLIALGRVLGQGRMSAAQLAWARIKRRALDNSVQLISFALTLMLLLVVLVSISFGLGFSGGPKSFSIIFMRSKSEVMSVNASI